MNSARSWKLAARVFIFIWFFAGGVSHFLIPAVFISIVPPSVPYPLAAVYISGALELLGAIGLWSAAFNRTASYGLIVLTICVTPANFYMWQHAQDFPSVPAWLLLVRLPFQLVLIWLIWWSATSARLKRHASK